MTYFDTGSENETTELINVVGRIYKCKNLKTLMRCLCREISQFFDFKDIAIMFHDQEKGQLYTIAFGDERDSNA